MGGIPLAALAINTQQPNPLDTAAKAMNLQSLMQEAPLLQAQVQEAQIGVQQKQQQLKDQQAVTAAMHQWDGKDPDDLPGLVLKQGGSGNAAFGLKSQILDQKIKAATLDKDTLANQSAKNDVIAGHLESVKSADPASKQDAYTSAINDLVQKGYVKPGQLPQQYPGDDQLTLAEKQFMVQKAIVDQEQNNRKITAQEQEAQARSSTAQTAATRLQAEQPGGSMRSPEQKEMDSFLAAPPKGYQATPQDFAKWKAQLAPQAQSNVQNAGAAADNSGNPSAIAQAIANKTMKWSDAVSARTPLAVKNQILQQVYKIDPKFDTSEFGLEQQAAEKARSGAWADTRLAYNTALDHSDLLLKASDALNNGDVKALNSLGNAFKTEFGWSGKINYDAIANAYNHEVTSVISKGHMTDAEVQSGHATLPDNANAQTIRDVVNSYKSLMTSKRGELDKIIKAGAGNKANAIINTGSDSGAVKPPTHPFFDQFGGTVRPNQ